MLECPAVAMRRLAPDPVQLQVIVGSLLGAGGLTGCEGRRQLSIAHQRDAYARWKYERLGSLAAGSPVRTADRTQFVTIAHPVFDDLACLDRAALLGITGPLGLAVWLADLDRFELRRDSFLPDQHAAFGATPPRRRSAARASAPVAAQRSRECAAGTRAPR